MSFEQDVQRFMQLCCLGCRGGRKMQQAIICQWLLFGAVVYVWFWFNGGLMPGFLSSSRQTPESDLINHFSTNTQSDGLKVTWIHAANSMQAMRDAVQSDVMMIEGDVLLRGQGTDNQQLVPVMAHPPQKDSDITLQQWLHLAQDSSKGIKLDFKSIDSVDLGLQILAEAKDKLHVPVHLSAEVAEGPNSFLAPNKYLDAARFIKQCKTSAPSSALALGWTNGWSNDKDSQKLYTWAMVKAMYDIIEDHDIHPPLTFNVRAKLAKNSLTQLKWLMEMTGGTLTLFSPGEDKLVANDILNVRHRLPVDKVYYDIQESIKAELHSVPQDGGADERNKFTLSQWKAVRSKGGEKIYLGSEALVFQNGLLVSKDAWTPPGDSKSTTISGRVEFINIPTVPESGDSATSPVGLGVFLRVSQSSVASILSGIRCFIGFDGRLEVSTQSIPGIDRKLEGTVSGTLPCFTFTITDTRHTDTITVLVSRLQTCTDTVPQPDDDHVTKLEFSMKDINVESQYMAIRAPSTQAFVIIDQFNIQ